MRLAARDARRPPPSPSTRRMIGGAVLTLAAVGAGVGAMTVGLAVSAARAVVTPPGERREDVVVHAVDRSAETITVSLTPETALPGRYSLWFDRGRGHARVGTIIGRGSATVTRRVESVQRGDLVRATRARWGAWYFLTPSDLGGPFESVSVPTELGPAPAWLLPAGTGGDWVIHVHGRGVTRAEGLRAVPVARERGWTSLLISYRDDGEAPPSPDGRYALGDDEWRDVAAAIRFARARGARRIVLMGWSMGGATVLQTVLRASEAAFVNGVILESAAIDWRAILARQARIRRLPAIVQRLAVAMLSNAWGAPLIGLGVPIDLDRLDAAARASELGLPLLVLHSDDDPDVPFEPAVRLVAAVSGAVRFERFTVAGHTRLWNYDPGRFRRAIGSWLSGLD